jgi:hypothetical protein
MSITYTSDDSSEPSFGMYQCPELDDPLGGGGLASARSIHGMVGDGAGD